MTKRKVVQILEPDEEVRPVLGFEGLYSVTRTGKVWTEAKTMGLSRHGGRWLQTGLSSGYPVVALFKDQKQHMRYVHRLVAIAWIPNPENKPQINHINGDKTAPRVENLEWCTASENLIHAYVTGAHSRRARLTDAQVIAARTQVANGAKARAVAKTLGISESTMSSIINRKYYAHI